MDVTKRAGNEFKKCCAKLGAPVAPLRMNPRVVRWFTPGLHVKRWLVLLMVGMVLVSLGIGYALANVYRSGLVLPHIFYYLTLQFLDRYARFGLFAALGLGIILYALYKLTQSVLGPFLPGRDRALSEIIYNYRFLQKGPRVVALGGGTGLSTLLRGLKKYTGNLTAIVTVADDGGQLRPAPCRVPDPAAGRLPPMHHSTGRRRAAHDHPLPAPLQGGQPERALVRESLHHGHGRDHRRLRARDPGVRAGPGRPRADRAVHVTRRHPDGRDGRRPDAGRRVEHSPSQRRRRQRRRRHGDQARVSRTGTDHQPG